MRKEFALTLRLSIPLIISNIAQVALSLTDSAMVGVVSYKQLAASSLVINALGIPQVLCMGITIAISPLVGIARGANNAEAASRHLYNGFWLSVAFTTLMVAACLLASPLLAHMGQDADIIPYAIPYFNVMAISLIPMVMFLSVKQFSDALEHPYTGMIIAILSVPLNIFLNWIFIYGKFGMPRWELFGTGVATLITRVISALVMIAIVMRHKTYAVYMSVRKQAWVLSKRSMKEILHIGIPAGLQLTMEAGAFAFSGIMVGWLGAKVQAAHQIALEIASTTFMAAMGLSAGAGIRVSHAFGGKRFPQLRTIGRGTQWGAMLYGMFCFVSFVVFRWQLPHLFTHETEVVAIAAQLLLVAGAFQISDSMQVMGAGLLRGIKDVKVPTALVIAAYWIIGIPVGYWLAFPMGLGATGIWVGLVVGLSLAAVFLNFRFNRMSWKLDHA